tara:strand:- start:300 stop:605 length:306 start_codon:yes stop_codon:yes gene_type:complete
METKNLFTPTSYGLWGTDLWADTFWFISPGDLVSVGPVYRNRIGIALQIKHVAFGLEPDEWEILIDGRIETHSTVYIMPSDCKIQHNYNNKYMSYYGGQND